MIVPAALKKQTVRGRLLRGPADRPALKAPGYTAAPA